MEMALRVILDCMATSRHFASQLRVPSHSLTNAKEACLRAVLVEQVEHARGDFRIRPVVDRQGDAPSRRDVCGQRCPVRTEQLAARPQSGARQEKMIRDDGPEHPRP